MKLRKEKRKLEMKSISKLVVAAAALLFASAASAGTLYWQVDDDSGDIGAELWMVEKETGTKASLSEGLIDAPTGIQQADLTSYDADKYLFFVELVNYSTGDTTEGYKWGYGDLVSSGYVAFDGRDIPTVRANALAHGNFANAPEPSSGLLLLMGGAMLALRRRRQK